MYIEFLYTYSQFTLILHNYSTSPLEAGLAAPSSILVWRVPWTEDPDGLWSAGFQRVEHYWSNLAHMHTCMQISGSGRKKTFELCIKICNLETLWFASQYFFFLSHLKLFTFTEVAKLYIEFLYIFS